MPHQRFQRFLSGFFTTKPHSEADQAGAKYIIRTDACAFTCSAKLGVSTLVTTRLIPYINQTSSVLRGSPLELLIVIMMNNLLHLQHCY